MSTHRLAYTPTLLPEGIRASVSHRSGLNLSASSPKTSSFLVESLGIAKGSLVLMTHRLYAAMDAMIFCPFGMGSSVRTSPVAVTIGLDSGRLSSCSDCRYPLYRTGWNRRTSCPRIRVSMWETLSKRGSNLQECVQVGH